MNDVLNAAHEAGHCLAALATRHEVGSVAITPRPETRVRAPRDLGAAERARMRLGGAAAEALTLRRTQLTFAEAERACEPARKDFLAARHALGDDVQELERAWAEAVALVKRRRLALLQLARRLLERGRVSGAEAKRIVEEW